jgi:hypothetical protein
MIIIMIITTQYWYIYTTNARHSGDGAIRNMQYCRKYNSNYDDR